MTIKSHAERPKTATVSAPGSLGLTDEQLSEVVPAPQNDIDARATSLRAAASAAAQALDALASLMERSPGPFKNFCTPVPDDAYSGAVARALEALLDGYGHTEIAPCISEHDPLRFAFAAPMTYGRRKSFLKEIGEPFSAVEAALGLVLHVPQPSHPAMPQRTRVAADYPEKLRMAALRILAAAGQSECGKRTDELVKSENDQSREPSSISDDAFLCETDVARVGGVNQSTLRKHLKKWRASHQNNDWHRNQNKRPRDPEYTYRWGSIRLLVEGIRGTTNRTAKKKSTQCST